MNLVKKYKEYEMKKARADIQKYDDESKDMKIKLKAAEKKEDYRQMNNKLRELKSKKFRELLQKRSKKMKDKQKSKSSNSVFSGSSVFGGTSKKNKSVFDSKRKRVF